MQPSAPVDEVPLFVDLDGTLVRTDTSTESCFRLIRRNIGYVLLLPWWLLRGKAHLKEQVARRVLLDVEHLPFRQDVIDYLRQQKAAGRKLVLATAANARHALQVAEHLDLFESVEASDEDINLEGKHKLARLRARSSDDVFDYAADDLADMAIFPHARRIIVVAPPPELRRAVRQMPNVERVFDPDARTYADLAAALRPERWPMNLLVLLPQLWAQGQGDWFGAGVGLAAFCLASSGSYLFHDLLHLPERRRLPEGRRGAIAEGKLALQRAGMAIAVFWFLAVALGLVLSGSIAAFVAAYIVLSVTGSQDWLRVPRWLTGMLLALSRVAAGAQLVAQPLPILPWLLGLAIGAAGSYLGRRNLGYV